MNERPAYWPFVLYALTGFAGLLAEQGFEKYISLLVGATASASAVVIFAYFLGFAIGSSAAGELLKRGIINRPLRVYGILEFLVGLSCILFTFAFHPLVEWLAPFQAYYSNPLLKLAVRFAFGSVLILPTAALMGASFPLMAHVVDREDLSGGRRWTEVYAANLTGAVAAALLGSYAVIPAIGIRGSFWLCFGIGMFVFAVALVLREPESIVVSERLTDAGPRERLKPGKDAWILLGASFASGLVFFALEVLWIHLIAVALGCSIYAFSSMLVTVLLGLLLAAFRVRRVLEKQTAIVYSSLFQFGALLLVCQFRCWDMAQALFVVPLPSFLRSFHVIEAYKLLIAGILIVPSAVCLGSIYPYLLGSPVLKRPGQSYLVGYLSTANSVGCLIGALLGVFFLLPVLGSELSMKVVIIALLLVSFLFLWRERPVRKRLIRAALGSALVLGYAVVWRWDRSLLTSGLNVYFGGRGNPSAAAAAASVMIVPKLIYFHEAAQGGMTTVVELTITESQKTSKVRTLFTNGKFQGDDGSEGEAQIGFSVIPSLFVNQLDRVLLVGLGTGHSARALKQVGYKEVDIAEFAPGIVTAAETWFSHLNANVLKDPAVRLALEDGRNILLTNADRRYDLITLEMTSIWFSGATNLYSTEFYDLAKKRLKPRGVLQQWVQLHHITPREVGCAIASVRSVFPYVSLWYFGGQGMIVASERPQELPEHRAQFLAGNAVRLIRSGETPAKLCERILASQLIGTTAVDKMIASLRPRINTDHNRWMEYATPRYNWSDYDWREYNLAFFAAFDSSRAGRVVAASAP